MLRIEALRLQYLKIVHLLGVFFNEPCDQQIFIIQQKQNIN